MAIGFWAFGFLCVIFAALAAIAAEARTSIVSLWISGLAAGGLYLSLHCEFLAIAQWIVCSTAGICCFLVAGMYGRPDAVLRVSRIAWAIVVASLFLVLSYYINRILPSKSLDVTPLGLEKMGEALIDHYFVGLEVIGITLLLSVVGIGGIAGSNRSREGTW